MVILSIILFEVKYECGSFVHNFKVSFLAVLNLIFVDLSLVTMKTELDITAHIRELLFGHDCVIIPGFGGFIGNYMPARLDKAAGSFHPPVKKISFNRNLNHNDGLLIKKISSSASMNYGDTRNMVEEFVSDVRKRLDKGETVVFGRIGSFRNNHEGNIQFEPDEEVNYYLDSYGMEPISCVPLEGYDVRKRILGREADRKHHLRRYLWRAAVLIPVAGAIIAVSLNTDFLKSGISQTTMNPLVSAEFEHNKAALDSDNAGTTAVLQPSDFSEKESVKADTALTDTPALTSDDIVAEPEAVMPAADNAEASLTASGSFYIITGSFQSEENAGKQVSQLQAEGFNPQVVAANGFYRVCAMSCPDLTTAVAKKDSILGKFPGAWISRKK